MIPKNAWKCADKQRFAAKIVVDDEYIVVVAMYDYETDYSISYPFPRDTPLSIMRDAYEQFKKSRA